MKDFTLEFIVSINSVFIILQLPAFHKKPFLYSFAPDDNLNLRRPSYVVDDPVYPKLSLSIPILSRWEIKDAIKWLFGLVCKNSGNEALNL